MAGSNAAWARTFYLLYWSLTDHSASLASSPLTGTKRALVALEGDTQPSGWVSEISKNGSENLDLFVLPTQNQGLIDIEGAAAKLAAATNAAGSWASSVWAAAGAWAEAAVAVSGAQVAWDRAGPSGMTQRGDGPGTHRQTLLPITTPRSSGGVSHRSAVGRTSSRSLLGARRNTPQSSRLREIGNRRQQQQQHRDRRDDQIDERMDARLSC